MTCCDFRDAADRQFTAAKAAKELKAYHKGRLGPTTRLLHDGNVGFNQGFVARHRRWHRSAYARERGMRKGVVADASGAYVSASTEIVQGDLLELGAKLPSADLVTLDRVVCCYPADEPMLEEATRHAEHGLAFVISTRPLVRPCRNGAGERETHRGKKAAAALSKTLTFGFRAHDLPRTRGFCGRPGLYAPVN